MNRRLFAGKTLLLLALLVPLAASAVSTPEIHARIVDARTGEPQQWTRATVYAGKRFLLLCEGWTEVPVYTKSYYFHADNGELAVPAQHFLVFDIINYLGWSLVVKCPGHRRLVVPGKTLKRLLEAHPDGCAEIKVEPYQSGGEWFTGTGDWDFSQYMSHEDGDSSYNPRLQLRGTIEEYRWLLAHWTAFQSLRFGLTASMYDRGPAGYFGNYLGKIDRFCTEFSGSHPDQCREVKDEACGLIKSLPTEVRKQIELRGFKWEHPWLDIGKDP